MYFRVKEILKEKGLTINGLSDMIGMNRVNLTNILNDRLNPSFDTILNIAKALDKPISELFTDSKSSKFICPKCGTELELKVTDQIPDDSESQDISNQHQP